jgi:hypothetical protein
MSTNSVWDDPEIKAGGDYIKLENVGDTVSGTVTAIRAHRFDDGKVAPQVLMVTDEGEERTLTAGQVRLKAELAEQRPEAGDHLKVTLSQIEKRAGGKTLKHFEVVITRATSTQPTLPAPVAAPAAVAAPAVAPAIDPAAAVAALANLTPEQRAALGLPAA